MIIATVVILPGLFNPTLIILVMVVLSLLIRQEKFVSLGLEKLKS
jgi:hypothetical protein